MAKQQHIVISVW